jgi:hypothetical protein
MTAGNVLPSRYKGVTRLIRIRTILPAGRTAQPEPELNRMVQTRLAMVTMAMAAAGATPAWAQPEVRATVGAYIQTELQWSSLGTPEDGRVFMDLHRVRPRIDFEMDDWISGRVEVDFAGGRVRLRNAYAGFDFGALAQVRVGQFKKPFGLIQLTSSSVIPVVERPTAIAGLDDRFEAFGLPVSLPDGRSVVPDEQTILDLQAFQGYAVGATVAGASGRLSWEAGFFEGPVGESGRSGAAGRAVFEAVPNVRVGAGVSHSQLRFADVERDGTAGALDLAVGTARTPGFGVLAEGVFGSGVGTGTNFAGTHAILWWHAATEQGRLKGIEPLVRASWADPDTDGPEDTGTLLTAGMNAYFGGRNRLMLNWDVYTGANDDIGTESALRLQAQIQF